MTYLDDLHAKAVCLVSRVEALEQEKRDLEQYIEELRSLVEPLGIDLSGHSDHDAQS